MKIQILFLILLISFVSAECNSGQIDVNSASLVDLDKLAGVGPTTAQNIVDSRPYTSLNDLLNATGIGEAKLASIKSQGLACVSTTDSHEKSPKNSEKDIEYSSKKSSEEELDPDLPNQETTTESIINLNSEGVISKSVQKEEVIFESKNEKVKRNLIFFFAFVLY